MSHLVLVSRFCTSYPSLVCLMRDFAIGSVEHSGSHTVPDIRHGIVADGEIKLC